MQHKREALLTLRLVVVLYCATGLHAQINRGVIEGIVTDPQGAFAPNVTVTITSVDTNVASTTRTNTSGYYRVMDLVPGQYHAQFVFTGFTNLEMTNIEVPAGKVTRVDAQLRIDATRQTVEVLAEAPLLETGASNFSTTLETRTIEEMPLQGRDLMQLVFLMPGVNSVAGPPGSNFGFNSQFGSFPDATSVLGSNLSVNGGQAGANAWYLDGNLNLSSFAENVTVNPTPDAVQEFQAITNAFAPEYSRTGGAVFNVVLKSGSNSFHGNLYEFGRNDATNARNPFTSVDSSGHLIKDRQLRYNNFGGTFGGPFILPKVYNGKNKSFFFFSWDTRILHLQGQQVFTVPTPRMRQGDFSEDPGISYGMWDPFTTIGPDPNTGLFQRTAFGTPVAGNPYGANGCLASSIAAGRGKGIATCSFASQLPTDRFDPIAMYFVNSFPLPNYNDPRSSCPVGKDGYKICNNFLGGVGTSLVPHNISLKVDHSWSEKNKWFVEWLYDPGKYRNFRVPWKGPTYPTPQVGYGTHQPLNFRNQIYGLGNTYMLSPRTINEFRYSFSRQYITAMGGALEYLNDVAALKEVQQKMAPLRLPTTQFYPTPSFNYIGTPGGGSLQFGPESWQNSAQMAEAHNVLDNLTKIIGKHTLKTGFLYRLEHGTWDSSTPTGLAFGGGIVSDPITGLGGGGGLAQFMLGALGNGDGNGAGLWTGSYNRWRYWGVYFQDDFRVTPHFSLNFGLRWDLYGWPRPRTWKPMSNFCLRCINPLTGLPGKIIFEGDPEYPKGSDIYPANHDNFGPRFNFSWSPFGNQKTVIRGGYDVFTSNAANANNFPGQFTVPGWQLGVGWTKSFYPDKCANFSGQCVAFPLSDTTTDKSQLTVPVLTGVYPAQKRDPLLGTGFSFYPKPTKDPMVQTWSLEVQHELPGNLLINLGYVGNRGTHLFGEPFRSLSYVHTKDLLKYRTAINATVPITDYFSGQTAAKLQEIYGGPTLQRSTLLSDYPFFPGLQAKVYDGASIYHGMNLRVQKRYSHGLNFIVAYTYSKKITNSSYANTAAFLVDPLHGVGSPGGRANSVLSTGFYQDPDNRRDRVIAVDDIPQIFNLAASYELPVGTGKAFLNRKGIANALFGGWKLTGNFNAQMGLPLSVRCPGNQVTSRCNLIGDPNFPGSRIKAQRIAQWINPAGFEPPFGSDQSFWANYDPNDDRAYRFGNSGAQLPFLRSPGFWNLDTSLSKRFTVRETKYFELRWEAFNALNHQNLGIPNTGFCLPPKPDGSTDLVHIAGCQFGRINNVQTDPRSMEFALKFFF